MVLIKSINLDHDNVFDLGVKSAILPLNLMLDSQLNFILLRLVSIL